MSETAWLVAHTVIIVLYDAWTFAYCARLVLRTLGRSPMALANRVFFELRPFFPAIIIAYFVVGAVVDGSDGAGWRGFTVACGALNWWMSRRDKDDDDRWKRRREALTARIADVGGRLAVVPT